MAAAELDHFVELGSLFRACTGNTLICKDAHKLPIRILVDEISVIFTCAAYEFC